MRKITLILSVVLLFSFSLVSAATLSCEQTSSDSLTITQSSSKVVQIQCTASDGTVSGVSITPNYDQGSGLSIENTQTISSSISDSSSSTGKWTVEGETPNTYTMSYTLTCTSCSKSWNGQETTQIVVKSAAQLSVEYDPEPSTYSSGDVLYFTVDNIGGTTANNVIFKLYRDGTLVKSQTYGSTIAGGSSAADNWGSSDGYDQAGTYETKVYIGDTRHDTVSITVSGDATTTTSTTTTTSGGSGGGGSVGGSKTTADPDAAILGETASKIIISASSGDEVDFEFSSTEIPLEGISFIANGGLNSVKISVSTLTSAPSTATIMAGNVFKYMKISKENLLDSNFEDAIISFKVDQSWLSSNGLQPEDVALFRYSNSVWTELETEFTGTGIGVYIFEATSPGFSYFAIGIKGTESVTTTLTSPSTTVLGETTTTLEQVANIVCGDDICHGEEIETCPQDCPSSEAGEDDVNKTDLPAFLWITIIIAIALLIVGLVAHKHHKKH